MNIKVWLYLKMPSEVQMETVNLMDIVNRCLTIYIYHIADTTWITFGWVQSTLTDTEHEQAVRNMGTKKDDTESEADPPNIFRDLLTNYQQNPGETICEL